MVQEQKTEGIYTDILVITICWRRKWQPTPMFLPGKSHGWRSLVGCSPWGREELDMTEWLHFHFSLSCIEEGNGNPLQCSCLDNPRDGGVWWAAIYGVAQSQTQLKRLSSSSSNDLQFQRHHCGRWHILLRNESTGEFKCLDCGCCPVPSHGRRGLRTSGRTVKQLPALDVAPS